MDIEVRYDHCTKQLEQFGSRYLKLICAGHSEVADKIKEIHRKLYLKYFV
jgi:hypothetical protein